MRKILISAALLSGLAFAAAPASAQYGRGGYDRGGYDRGGYGYGYNQGGDIHRQLGQLDQRIDHLFQRRLISSNEARRLSREVDQIERLFERYRRNGLSQGEHHDLMRRIHHLRQEIREERREGREDRRDDRRYDRRW
jgi:hypothetical protein